MGTVSMIRGAPRRTTLAGVAVLAAVALAGPAIAQGLGEDAGQPPAGTAPADPAGVGTAPLGTQPAPGSRAVVVDPAPLGGQPAGSGARPAGPSTSIEGPQEKAVGVDGQGLAGRSDAGGVDGSADGGRSD